MGVLSLKYEVLSLSGRAERLRPGLMIGAALALVLAGPGARADAPGDLYAQGAALYEKGDREAAEIRFADFRRRYAEHRMFWPANLMWARCAADPKTAARRFREVGKGAPPAVRAECELELSHLLMMEGKFAEAAGAYGTWLRAHGKDERAEEAAYWRGFCLRQGGKAAEAAAVLDPLYRAGTRATWRGLAGLLLAEMAAGEKDREAAYDGYVALAEAPWARDVRPQALLGAARMTENSWRRKRFAGFLERDHPETDEAEEARKLLREAAGGGVRYGVQVGAFVSKAGALAEKEAFERKGHPATIVRREQVGLDLYAVIVGPYDSMEAAARKKNEIRRSGHPTVFVTTY